MVKTKKTGPKGQKKGYYIRLPPKCPKHLRDRCTTLTGNAAESGNLFKDVNTIGKERTKPDNLQSQDVGKPWEDEQRPVRETAGIGSGNDTVKGTDTVKTVIQNNEQEAKTAGGPIGDEQNMPTGKVSGTSPQSQPERKQLEQLVEAET